MARYPIDTSLDFPTRIALGQEKGFSLSGKFSKRLSISIGATEDVWCGVGAARVDLTSPERMVVVSDSAQDVAGGTGASGIVIEGVGPDFIKQTELIALNGLTPVTTTNTWLAVNNVFMQGGQSSLANVGNVTLTSEITLNEQDRMLPNQGMGCASHYTVPAGHTFVFRSFSLYSEKVDEILAELRIKTPTTGTYITVSEILVNTGDVRLENVLVPLPEKTTLKFRATAVTNNAKLFVTYTFLLAPI